MSSALLQENFEKALETINALSEQNEALMDEIQSLKFKLSLSEKPPSLYANCTVIPFILSYQKVFGSKFRDIK